MKTLHNDGLKTLIALQYYMSTLSQVEDERIRQNNYSKSLEVMLEAVKIMMQTADLESGNGQDTYPEELLLIIKNINNIKQKFTYLNQNTHWEKNNTHRLEEKV